MTDPTADNHHMQCMEVWGGNQAVDGGVVMAGLDAWVYSRPYHDDVAGGDVYYVSSCATGRITRLLVADVSGHGESVGEVGSALRHLMRRYVNHIDQRRFVVDLNREFTSLATEGRFATAVVASFFAPTNFLAVCNAGHPPPLIYRTKKRRWSILEPWDEQTEGLVDMPLGIADLSQYRQTGTRLNVGDLILCYTDSAMESIGADGRQLGMQGLLAVVQELNVSDPSILIPQLIDKIVSLADGNLEGDDATILLFRPNGLAPRVSFRERAMAPLRLIGGLFGAMRPGGQPMPWPEMTLANIGGAMFQPFNRLWGGRKPPRVPRMDGSRQARPHDSGDRT